MARVLFAWECGAGLHHLANVEALARALEPDGHELAVALRELDNAPALLAGMPLQYLQAPFRQAAVGTEPASGYAHVLQSAGLDDLPGLQVRLSAWIGLMRSFQPDVIVFDHAPTALLASRVFDARRVVVGAGFGVPPPASPLGMLPDVKDTEATRGHLLGREAALLATANRALAGFGARPLGRLADVFEEVDESFLLTYPELDPFGPREAGTYLGSWAGSPRRALEWPSNGKPHVLAYLYEHSRHPRLLEALAGCGAYVVVVSGEAPVPPEDPGAETLHFERGLLDLAGLANGCDLFVSCGSHSSVCQTLARGVPQLIVPEYREQALTARRVAALGAGAVAEATSPDLAGELADCLRDTGLRQGARRFAAAHADDDPAVDGPRRFRETVRRLAS